MTVFDFLRSGRSVWVGFGAESEGPSVRSIVEREKREIMWSCSGGLKGRERSDGDEGEREY